ncbi:MAG: sigma 54-interacting transcriptional regulator [Deltaproteobacteria bacterium]|nr:sigma 54-interacting transcriptional regulator [Deltaproteobacteria bacterium]
MGKILVIDDDLSMREVMELILKKAGHTIELADGGSIGLEMALTNDYNLVISDIRMPDLSGLEVLKRLRLANCQTTVVLISAYATDAKAVEAMNLGAYDLIPKPFRPTDLVAVVDSALAHHSVEIERQALAEMVINNQRFSGLVGSSPAMLQVYELIKRTAQTNTSILITGESGTGKELVARAVHANSSRAEKNFVAINCGGMPDQLVESELFGYKKGAFTGANSDKQGLIATADGGTLFLDELAELTLPMQVKLLRVVQEKTFRPVGSNTEQESDVRFIAATNKSLESEIIAGRFREDLYYRLNVINIRIPPLRERAMDIPILAHFFLDKYSRQQNKDVRKLSTYALDILTRYRFPGNVRELENIIERSVALEQSNIILPESLHLADFKRQQTAAIAPPTWSEAQAVPAPEPPTAPVEDTTTPMAPENPPEIPYLTTVPAGGLDDILTALEGYYLYNALITAGGARNRAATLLDISPWRLRMRLVAFSLVDLNPMELMSLSKERFSRPLLSPELAPEWNGNHISLDSILHQVERHFIKLALEKSRDNKTEAAISLGLSRRSFQHRIDRTNYEQELTNENSAKNLDEKDPDS